MSREWEEGWSNMSREGWSNMSREWEEGWSNMSREWEEGWSNMSREWEEGWNEILIGKEMNQIATERRSVYVCMCVCVCVCVRACGRACGRMNVPVCVNRRVPYICVDICTK